MKLEDEEDEEDLNSWFGGHLALCKYERLYT